MISARRQPPWFLTQIAKAVVRFERHRFAVYSHFILLPRSLVLVGRRGGLWRAVMRLVFAAVLAFSLAGSALAQQSAPPPDQAPPPNAAGPAEQPAPGAAPQRGRQPSARRINCMNTARQQGLRAQQLRDSVQLCMEEARLACTKKAIEQNIPGPGRREFMRNCAG
jgi:hypothetical protein